MQGNAICSIPKVLNNALSIMNALSVLSNCTCTKNFSGQKRTFFTCNIDIIVAISRILCRFPDSDRILFRQLDKNSLPTDIFRHFRTFLSNFVQKCPHPEHIPLLSTCKRVTLEVSLKNSFVL
jgi:hypothetical protein